MFGAAELWKTPDIISVIALSYFLKMRAAKGGRQDPSVQYVVVMRHSTFALTSPAATATLLHIRFVTAAHGGGGVGASPRPVSLEVAGGPSGGGRGQHRTNELSPLLPSTIEP